MPEAEAQILVLDHFNGVYKQEQQEDPPALLLKLIAPFFIARMSHVSV